MLTKVNLDEVLGYFDRELTEAMRQSNDKRREYYCETEVLRVLLRSSAREGSKQEYELLQQVAPSIARAVHRTVSTIAFADPTQLVTTVRRKLPPRFSGWIEVPERVAR